MTSFPSKPDSSAPMLGGGPILGGDIHSPPVFPPLPSESIVPPPIAPSIFDEQPVPPPVVPVVAPITAEVNPLNTFDLATESPAKNSSSRKLEPDPIGKSKEPKPKSKLSHKPHTASSITLAGGNSNELNDESGNPTSLFASVTEMPSWLVSTIVHVSLILLLALIPMHHHIEHALGILIGEGGDSGGNDGLSSFDLSGDNLEEASPIDEGISTTSLETMDIVIKDPTLPSMSGPLVSSKSPILGGLSGRSAGMKGALLRAFGGTGGTEAAVSLGLDWIVRNQTSDGSWSLIGPYKDGSVTENRPAATAMALLALMGAGNTHLDGVHKNAVARGTAYLLTLQDADGFFAAKAAGNTRTYAQAQSTIALCELYGMTGDEKLRKPAQLAVKYAEFAQHPGGGWRYQPKDLGDTSVTGWYVMALISARMAGLDVDSEVLERVHNFLDSVQRKQNVRGQDSYGELYSYQSYTNPTPPMTAEGMLCRMYLGWSTTDPRIESGCEYLCQHLITSDINERSYYYWYYATSSLHHVGGAYWTRWNDQMRDILPGLQTMNGRDRGSWSPQGDPHGAGGGRLYATCFSVLCLESYYRHLPLSDIAKKESKK